MARTIKEEIQYFYSLVDMYKDLEGKDVHKANIKVCLDFEERYSQIAEWLEELVTLRKAFDLACDEIPHLMAYACDDCMYNNMYYKCDKGLQRNSDGTFDCDNAEWWKEQLIKEANSNG